MTVLCKSKRLSKAKCRKFVQVYFSKMKQMHIKSAEYDQSFFYQIQWIWNLFLNSLIKQLFEVYLFVYWEIGIEESI